MPLVFTGFFFIASKNHRAAIAWLVAASIFFYGYWSPYALPILLTSICLNYWLGSQLSKTELSYRKILLIISISANLLALGYFKYVNFFIINTNSLRDFIGLDPLNNLDVILPIGISFFTFTQVAYLVDSFQKKTVEQSFLNYLLFVTFFPHLIAGPIIHHKQMMPQFTDPETFSVSQKKIVLGITAFTIGLAKKLLLADPLGAGAEKLFNIANAGGSPGFVTAWLGSFAYTFQMYFDFSGYSDMAVGLALLFGIWLPFNFNSPLKATSIISFWQRWHMSLTSYINQYLYTPLTLKGMRLGIGRSKGIELSCGLIIPTITTMVIVGIWHGAGWTFVVFGAMHGVFLVVNHIWHKRNFCVRKKGQGPALSYVILSWFITFLSVTVALVMFRSDSVHIALQIYEGMCGVNGFYNGMIYSTTQLLLLLTALFIVLYFKSSLVILKSQDSEKKHYLIRGLGGAIFLAILFVSSVLQLSKTSPFLYFQF